MRDMTAANLRSAFGGESQAHMRYKIWADVAEKEGFCNVASLFEAVSFAEQIHATSHFSVLKDVKGAFRHVFHPGAALYTGPFEQGWVIPDMLRSRTALHFNPQSVFGTSGCPHCQELYRIVLTISGDLRVISCLTNYNFEK